MDSESTAEARTRAQHAPARAWVADQGGGVQLERGLHAQAVAGAEVLVRLATQCLCGLDTQRLGQVLHALGQEPDATTHHDSHARCR
jgi:hypothetical protein